MPSMKAIQLKSPGADFELVDKEIPEPKANEVLIKVEACGVCHGDALVKEGRYPGLQYPRTPGHEVVGVIERLGSKSQVWKVGQRVGVGWRAGYCGSCRACRRGEFWACENPLATGINVDGGYAEYMVARLEAINAIPDELSSVEAAPLLCAGSTTLGALKNCAAKAGDLIAIHGLGGLGHLALQFAVKMGLDTVVLSRGTEKEELALELGAHHFIDTNAANAAEELMKLGGARVILCTAPNSKAIAELVNGLSRNGQIMIITFVNEPMMVLPVLLMRGVKSISGWIGGNIGDTLRFSILTKVVPMVEVFPLEQAATAFDRMMTAKVHFRAVLKMGGESNE
jgi:D-arabinose 1-dehydrogenase-like Zn-dependent alcohol dehydrogenase